jgi:hypothetical protein
MCHNSSAPWRLDCGCFCSGIPRGPGSPGPLSSNALADYFDVAHHTLHHVSTATALVEAIYQGAVRVGTQFSIPAHLCLDFGMKARERTGFKCPKCVDTCREARRNVRDFLQRLRSQPCQFSCIQSLPHDLGSDQRWQVNCSRLAGRESSARHLIADSD